MISDLTKIFQKMVNSDNLITRFAKYWVNIEVNVRAHEQDLLKSLWKMENFIKSWITFDFH